MTAYLGAIDQGTTSTRFIVFDRAGRIVSAAQKAFGVPVTESPTRAHVLYGGGGFTGDLWEKLAAAFPIAKETAHHLAAKFGTTAWEVLELTKQSRGLAEPILAGSAPIQAEVIYSIRHELAATLEDILARRLGVQFLSLIHI